MQHTSSPERNEIFDLAFRFVTETSENIFLTGKAGTGKTTFMKYLKENSAKNIIIAAPTGVAAINAGGVTLHSLFHLPFHPFLPTKNSREDLVAKTRFNKQRQQLLRKLELLVIDEISMVRCDVMDAIDTILKSVRRNYTSPFGGVQLLCIGDLHQLPPVAPPQDWGILNQYYSSPFFFDSITIRDQMPLLVELDKIYRQKDDTFIDLLNKVRNNNMNSADFDNLHVRFKPSFRPSGEEKYITLTSHNNQAEQINAREIQKLLSPSHIYDAEIVDDFPENSYPAEASLMLKEGAQVMFLKNDVIHKRYFNGKIGIVKFLNQEEIVVDCEGINISVYRETWENSRYVLDKADGKLNQETLGTFTQFPLRLAWAITIHKSQGLTFEKVVIDAGLAFSSGQVYVALSRCTSLDGIVLLSKIPAEAIYNNDNVIKGQLALTHKGSLAERFNGARQLFSKQLIADVFSFNEVASALSLLHDKIKECKDKMNKEGIDWIEQFIRDFDADRSISMKFIGKMHDLMKDEPVIENNALMQKRINDAALFFEPKLLSYQASMKNNPVNTEHREPADKINECLNHAMLVLYTANYYLQYCKQPFSVPTFLQHKIAFTHPAFKLTCYASGKKLSNPDVPNAELYEVLKSWRDKTCEDSGTPVYMVANLATLTEIATYLPLTRKDLLKITGFGNAKVNRYGDEILGFVEEYCIVNDMKSAMALKVENSRIQHRGSLVGAKTGTKALSYQLFKQGKSVTEIAAERKVTVSTIEGHLAWYVANGNIDLDTLIPLEKQLLVRGAAKKYGNLGHKILKENLPQDISYGEIKLVLALQQEAI